MIKLFSKENCSNCEMIKSKLRDSKVEFEEIHDEKEMLRIGQENFIMSAPIMQIDDKFYSGIDGLKALELI